MTGAFGTGFAMSFALIVAIGAQNAFVLRQGLRREHVLPVVVFCTLADAMLMAAGVAGMAQALGDRPALAKWLTVAGAVFLLVYGLRALWRSRRPGALDAANGKQSFSVAAALAQAAAFTLLNPHVYLDTVLLVGTVGAQFAGMLKGVFVAGASLASVVWFFGLGFGARMLAPVFARPGAWRVLDALIGATMLLLAYLLAQRAMAGA
ncbi:LysE/ArgO family amino acid transporter [Variovorax sp. J22R133]|uniref:LysE/ArgO family amino acid transporter n=1 Tax=Variovorax brevis TaxID=3053503 RepID=UPI0025758C84|nr:LysE/ArgO family amino acid transporter [Variovorax sp. J22R133]MDM0114534.1 LysE/ArgO family amino acid transporter [Variovorax sp. J22R133]